MGNKNRVKRHVEKAKSWFLQINQNFLPVSLLAVVVYAFIVRIIMIFGIKNQGEVFVPWVYSKHADWGVGNKLLLINILFFLYLFLDIITRIIKKQNRIWLGIYLFIAFSILGILQVTYQNMFSAVQLHVKTGYCVGLIYDCFSPINFPITPYVEESFEDCQYDAQVAFVRLTSKYLSLRQNLQNTSDIGKKGRGIDSSGLYNAFLKLEKGSITEKHLTQNYIPSLVSPFEQFREGEAKRVRDELPTWLAEEVKVSVSIAADKDTLWGTLHQIMNTARLAGITKFSVLHRMNFCQICAYRLPLYLSDLRDGKSEMMKRLKEFNLAVDIRNDGSTRVEINSRHKVKGMSVCDNQPQTAFIEFTLEQKPQFHKFMREIMKRNIKA